MNTLNWFFFIPDYIDKSHNSFKIFGFDIYYYAIAITLGMLTCVLLTVPLFKKKGVKPDLLLDFMIGIIPTSIIFARMFYVLFGIDEFITDGKFDFLEAIDIRGGGMAIYGGVAGGALGVLIVSLIHKLPPIKFFDIGAAMLPLGQAIGRWGNYFNQEVYGGVDPAGRGLPISVFIQSDGNYHYALFLWEAACNVLLFALLYTFMYRYKGKRNGYGMSFYAIGYGLIRLLMEPLRDSQFNLPVFGVSGLGMWWTSLALILLGVTVLTVVFVRDFKENDKNFRKYWKNMFGEKKPATAAAKAGGDPAKKPGAKENGTRQQKAAAQAGAKKTAPTAERTEEKAANADRKERLPVKKIQVKDAGKDDGTEK